MIYQGELEHRTPKARYRRTNRKKYIEQITKIERRQARIRRIRAQHQVNKKQVDTAISDPNSRFTIGKSENNWDHIGTFIKKNEDDPAIKVREYVSLDEPNPNAIIYRILSQN